MELLEELETTEKQCGFVEGKRTEMLIYTLQTITERTLEVEKEVYLCLIDYTKAFNRLSVQLDETISHLTQDKKIDG